MSRLGIGIDVTTVTSYNDLRSEIEDKYGDIKLPVKIDLDTSSLNNIQERFSSSITLPISIDMARIDNIHQSISDALNSSYYSIWVRPFLDTSEIISQLRAKDYSIEIETNKNTSDFSSTENVLNQINASVDELNSNIKEFRANLASLDLKEQAEFLRDIIFTSLTNMAEKQLPAILEQLKEIGNIKFDFNIGKQSAATTNKIIGDVRRSQIDAYKKLINNDFAFDYIYGRNKQSDYRRSELVGFADTLVSEKGSLANQVRAGERLYEQLKKYIQITPAVQAAFDQVDAALNKSRETLSNLDKDADNKFSQLKSIFGGGEKSESIASIDLNPLISSLSEIKELISQITEKININIASESIQSITNSLGGVETSLTNIYNLLSNGLIDKLDDVIENTGNIRFDTNKEDIEAATEANNKYAKSVYSALKAERALASNESKNAEDEIPSLSRADKNQANLQYNLYKSMVSDLQNASYTNYMTEDVKNIFRRYIDAYEERMSEFLDFGKDGYLSWGEGFNLLDGQEDKIEFASRAIKDLANSYEKAGHARADFLKFQQARMFGDKEIANLNKLNVSISSYIENNGKIASNNDLYSQLLTLQQAVKDNAITAPSATKQFALLKAEFKDLGLETQSLTTKFTNLLKTKITSFLDHMAILAAERAFKQVYAAIKEIDTAMTELRKVTDETEASYAAFMTKATKQAQELGSTIGAVVNATADFARLGYNLEDASELANAAIIYKNVGDGISDIGVASESIISTMKAFGIEASNSMEIVDKFNTTGNNFAISSRGVGEALVRSASALAQANNSLDESIALITRANTIVQNPDTVGTALKTLSLRIGKTKADMESIGEDAEGMAETVSQYRAEILSLTKGAVDIMTEDQTSYKSTYEILKELSEIWDELDQKVQNSIIYDLGGTRQANTLSAIIENFDIAEDVVAKAESSAGSAARENEIYLDSISGKLSIMTANFQALSTELLDSNLVKVVLDLANSFLQLSSSLIKVTDVLPLLASAKIVSTLSKANIVPDVMSEVKNGVNPLKAIVQTGTNAIKNSSKNKEIEETLKNLSEIFGVEKDESGSFKVSRMFASWEDFSKSQTSIMKEQIEGDIFKEVEVVTDLGKAYNSLNDANKNYVKTLITESSGIESRNSQLLNYMKTLENSGSAAFKFESALKMVGKAAVAAVAVAALAFAFKEVQKAVDALVITIDEQKSVIEEYTKDVESLSGEYDTLREKQKDQGLTSGEQERLKFLELQLALLNSTIEAEEKELFLRENTSYTKYPWEYNPDKAASEGYGLTQAQQTVIQTDNAKEKAAGIVNDFNSATEKNDVDKVKKSIQEAESQALELRKIILENNKSIEILSDGLAKGWDDEEGTAAKRLKSLQDQNDAYEETLDLYSRLGMIPSLFEKGKEGASEAVDLIKSWNIVLNDTGHAFDAINDSIDEAQKAFSVLNDAVLEYNTQGAYSIDTLQALSDLDDRYLDFLIDENGQLNLNTDAVHRLMEARTNELRLQIVRQGIDTIQKLNDEQAATDFLANKNIELAQTELDAAKATLVLEATLASSRGGEKMAEAIDVVIGRVNLMMKAVGDLGAANGKSTSATKALAKAQNDRKKRAEDQNKALKARGKAMKDALNAQKKDLQAQQKQIDKQKDDIDDQIDGINDQIDAIEKKYDEEQKEFELQKRIVAWQQAQASKTVRVYSHENGWQWMADPEAERDARNSVEEYRRELARDKEKQGYEDQKKELEDKKKALDDEKEAIQENIDAISELINDIDEAMNLIGVTLEDYEQDLAFAAEATALNFDRMKQRANDYAEAVRRAMQPASVYESGDSNGYSSGIGWTSPKSDDVERSGDDFWARRYGELQKAAEAAGVYAEKIESIDKIQKEGNLTYEVAGNLLERFTKQQLDSANQSATAYMDWNMVVATLRGQIERFGVDTAELDKLLDDGIITYTDYVQIMQDVVSQQDSNIEKQDALNDIINETLSDMGLSMEDWEAIHAEMSAKVTEEAEQASVDIGTSNSEIKASVKDMTGSISEQLSANANGWNDWMKTVVTDTMIAAAAIEALKEGPQTKTISQRIQEVASKVQSDVLDYIPTFHQGGLVEGISADANVSNEFRKYMTSLKSNEVPAILQAGEWVLTKAQQKQIIDSNSALLGLRSRQNTGSVVFNGDIVINDPIGDVPSLSRAIIEKLPNQILVDMNKN